ncbi:peptidoglycan-binding protein [Streptomyces sp. NBC_01476]|uniref:peptidoglycan-binding protein n=1 Tax=Streptomyces sp. NBC_01476 TaxID=2903881 RepID=UPI002E3457A9|nr:peptidoglycan-binding protein [Streptomyces sp. NBC_01476]
MTDKTSKTEDAPEVDPRRYHVAVDTIDLSTGAVNSAYLGECDQAHVDEVRALAAIPAAGRLLIESPRQSGAFFVARDATQGSDGDLDVYVPVDAEPFEVRQPEPTPRASGRGARTATRGPDYIAGAVRFGSQSIGGAMDHPESGARFTWHTTESPAGGDYFSGVAAYLIRVASEPQVIYDPPTDRVGQFGPLSKSARALKNDASRRTNREGLVNIQVEVLGYAAKPWTQGFDPSKKVNWQRLLAAGRDWGIPDTWPAGPPSKANRNRGTWQSKAGHYGHIHVPGNDHTDPGSIDVTVVPGAADDPKPADPTVTNSFPGADHFGPGKNNSFVTHLGQMLVARGGGRFYKDGPGPKWSDADKDATAAFQKAQGWTGSDADGIPGPTTWAYLTGGKGKNIPPAAKPATLEPYPGDGFFHVGRTSPIVTALGRRLVALGFGKHYKSGPGPSWTEADRKNVADYQRSKPDLKGDPDGYPGPKTWADLKIPKL